MTFIVKVTIRLSRNKMDFCSIPLPNNTKIDPEYICHEGCTRDYLHLMILALVPQGHDDVSEFASEVLVFRTHVVKEGYMCGCGYIFYSHIGPLLTPCVYYPHFTSFNVL